MKSSQTK